MKSYLLSQKSGFRAGGPLSVQVQDTPFPSLRLGALRAPLTVNYGGGQAFPDRGEACAVKLDASGALLDYLRTRVPEKLAAFLAEADASAGVRVIVLGGPESGVGDGAPSDGYRLLYRIHGRSLVKRAARPQELALSADELRQPE